MTPAPLRLRAFLKKSTPVHFDFRKSARLQPESTLTLRLLYTRDEHGSGLKSILAGSGLNRTAIVLKIGGSGLDWTEKIFVVLM